MDFSDDDAVVVGPFPAFLFPVCHKTHHPNRKKKNRLPSFVQNIVGPFCSQKSTNNISVITALPSSSPGRVPGHVFFLHLPASRQAATVRKDICLCRHGHECAARGPDDSLSWP